MNRATILIIGLLTLLLQSCTSYEELAPFFDGLYLEYDWGSGTREIYNIQISDDDNFKVIETRKRKPLGDKTEEMLVNKNGIVYESTYKKYKDNFSPIWIPVREIKIGDKYDGRKLAERKDKWEKWEVLVVKDIPTGGESYYELETGYWVGGSAKTSVGVGKIVLINTNAVIPTIN